MSNEMTLEETQKWLKGLNNNYTVQELENLKWLYLDERELIELPMLPLLPNLLSFCLSNNKLTRIQSLSFNLPNLQYLWLNNNRLTSVSLDLPNLLLLDLSGNQLTEIPILSISYIPNLQELYLYNNQLKEISNLKLVPKLTTLNLRNNQLTEKSIRYVKSLDLKYLLL